MTFIWNEYGGYGDYRGIGLETAILFAQEGANVLLADINEKAVQEAAEKLRKKVAEVCISTLINPIKLQLIELDHMKRVRVG